MNNDTPILCQDCMRPRLEIVGSDIDETTEYERQLAALHVDSFKYPDLVCCQRIIGDLLRVSKAARLKARGIDRLHRDTKENEEAQN